MTNIDDDTVIKVGDEAIERVDSYVLSRDRQSNCEIKRRICLDWPALGKLRSVYSRAT